MVRKTLYSSIAVVGIAVASGLAWWYQNGNPRATGASGVAPVASGTGAPGGVAGTGSGAALAGGRAGPGAGGPVSVEVATVQSLALQDDAQSVGSLRSRQSVVLRPEVAGRIAQIGFAEGQRVRKGQLLVQLDDVLQKAELSQAQAALSIARANLKRNEELVAQAFVAQRVLDESRAALQVAEAQVALAQARLARMRVVAPFDGTVGLSNIHLGDYVKDGADLVNLEDTSQLLVDFRLPERYQPRIAPGQSVEVALDALPGQTFAARVQAVDPLLDANGRSIAVRAALQASAGSALRPGMFARVTTVFATQADALMVPEEAIVPQGGKQFVVTLIREGEGQSARSISRRVEVQLGVRRGAQVQVLSGLQAGQTVVIAGQQRLQRDGTAVRVVNMDKPARPDGTGPSVSDRAPGSGGLPRAAAG